MTERSVELAVDPNNAPLLIDDLTALAVRKNLTEPLDRQVNNVARLFQPLKVALNLMLCSSAGHSKPLTGAGPKVLPPVPNLSISVSLRRTSESSSTARTISSFNFRVTARPAVFDYLNDQFDVLTPYLVGVPTQDEDEQELTGSDSVFTKDAIQV